MINGLKMLDFVQSKNDGEKPSLLETFSIYPLTLNF